MTKNRLKKVLTLTADETILPGLDEYKLCLPKPNRRFAPTIC